MAIKGNGLFFQEKEKRLSDGATLMLSAESHVPCFQERVGTSIMGYMIPDRLPWRLRARPSATLHEIGSALLERTYQLDATKSLGPASRGIRDCTHKLSLRKRTGRDRNHMLKARCSLSLSIRIISLAKKEKD